MRDPDEEESWVEKALAEYKIGELVQVYRWDRMISRLIKNEEADDFGIPRIKVVKA